MSCIRPALTISICLVLVSWWLRTPTVLIVGLVTSAFISWARARGQTRREAAVVAGAMIDLTDEIAQILRSGVALPAAVLLAVERHPECRPSLGDLSSHLAAGVALDHALSQLAATEDINESVQLLAASTAVLVATGGPAAAGLDRVGDALRAARTARVEAQAQASQATASAFVLAALPVLFSLGLVIFEPAAIDFYLGTVLGGTCLTGMATLIGASWLWIDVLVWNQA